MAVTPPPTIADPPATLPDRGNRLTFTDAFEALLAWMIPGFWTFLNAVKGNVYDNALDAQASATAAAASANAAAMAAGASKWAAGPYTEGTTVWSPLDYQTYRRKATGASATDPRLDPGDWERLPNLTAIDDPVYWMGL